MIGREKEEIRIKGFKDTRVNMLQILLNIQKYLLGTLGFFRKRKSSEFTTKTI